MSDDSLSLLQGHQPQQTAERGQCAKPEAVSQRSFALSVVELMHDVMPPSTSASKPESERVEWVRFDSSDLSDNRLRGHLRALNRGEEPLIVTLGLARGYMIWALMANGDCEELVSDRQGPVKCAKLLPSPLSCFDVTEDQFVSKRPLVAVCDSCVLNNGRQVCSVGIMSLRAAEQVHVLRMEEPVYSLDCSQKVFLVVLSGKLLVCDTLSFTPQIWIRNCYQSDDLSGSPCALSATWLAYADAKLSSVYHSCGGALHVETMPSYASQVLSAAKNLGKTMTALGESVASGLAGGANVVRQSAGQTNTTTTPGIVTVLDLENFPKSQNGIHGLSDNSGVLAHFVAHLSEPVAGLHFSPPGSLLLTVGASGQCFNLFSLLPHPMSSCLAAVQHLYILFRGSTPAKAKYVSFSSDCRWLSVVTNHGTTHLFPITPYGGPISSRTHCSAKLVNRESTFHRTAGLDSLEMSGTSPPVSAVSPAGSTSPATPGGSQRGSPVTRDVHPGQSCEFPNLSKTAGNPRMVPLARPVVVPSIATIKQRVLSASNISVRAADLAPSSLTQTKTSASGSQLSRLAVAFGSSVTRNTFGSNVPGETAVDSAFVINSQGQLCEYALSAKPSAPNNRVMPPELSVTPLAQWTLQRTKSSPDLRPPLSCAHPLVVAAAKLADSKRSPTVSKEPKHTEKSRAWIAQVEMSTYAEPHRRLWMGPQFTFKKYTDTSHLSTDLVSPSDKQRRSDPVAMPLARSHRSGSGRAVPVVIESTSSSIESKERVTMEVCGSWSDNDYISCEEQEGWLRQSIAEAMKETTNTRADGVRRRESPLSDARSNVSESPSHDSLQFMSSMDP